MKHLIMGLFAMIAVGCAVDSGDEPQRAEQQELSAPASQAAEPGAPSIRGTCSPLGGGICAGQTAGATCSISPRRLFCLPSNDAPDGGFFCQCQSQSTI